MLQHFGTSANLQKIFHKCLTESTLVLQIQVSGNTTYFFSKALVYTLFSNNIQSKFGINHWIPFTEKELNAKDKFDSNFMSQFINGKLKKDKGSEFNMPSILFEPQLTYQNAPLKFSPQATAVFDAGRELWKYYHSQPDCNVNASLYDIRAYFQGRNEGGKMNNTSSDENYSNLIAVLRKNLKLLAKKIEPKVYEFEFLKA